MKLYPIFSSLIDVFIGDGWENWSRISIKNGRISVIAGLPLTDFALSVIYQRLEKK